MNKDIQDELVEFKTKMASTLYNAVQEYMAENTKEKIQEEVKKALDDSKQQILRLLLGFKQDSWGKKVWELDHCNGRSGNSIAGDYLKSSLKPAIDDWLSQADLKSVTMTDNMKKTLQREYRELLHIRIGKNIEFLAKEHADKIINDLRNADEFKKLLNAYALINPTKE